MSDTLDALNAGKELQRAATEALVLTVDGRTLIFPPINRFWVTTEQLRERPYAKRGKVEVFDEESFAAYVKRHATPGTHLYADEEAATLVAVLDSHDDEGAGWGRHRVTLVPKYTDAWIAWNEVDGVRKNQVEFGEFVENHLGEIKEPAGAVVLDMALNLEIKRGVTFSSAIRRDNGQTQLVYDEMINGSARSGSIQIPDHLKLALPPFLGSEPWGVEARFRYRLERGAVSMWVDLLRINEVRREAFRERVADVAARLGEGFVVLAGVAPGEVTAT